MKRFVLVTVALSSIPGRCPPASATDLHVVSTPLAPRPATQQSPLFRSRPAAETGCDFRHTWNPPPRLESARDRNFAGGGVAIGDFDGDRLPDIYLSRPFGGGQLYRNLGGWRFENVTERAGLGNDRAWAAAGSWADMDGDGDLDLYICGLDCPNRLWINNGKGNFSERAGAAGLDFNGSSVLMAWADYDLDGDLDGYLLTNRTHRSEGLAVASAETITEVRRRLRRNEAGQLTMPEDLDELYHLVPRPGASPVIAQAGQYDRLYRNDGPGPDGVPRFTDVTRAAGMLDNGLGLSATWWDHDADGRPDLYVANDYFGADRLWHNNGDGTFSDRAAELLPYTAWFSMGCDVADINNDGKLDLMVGDMAGSTHYKDKMSMGDMDQLGWFLEAASPRQYMRNTLFLNSGAGPFMEIAHLAGVAATDWTWAVKFADLDGDGWQDLYVTNGMTGDFLNSDLRATATGSLEDAPIKRDVHFAFRNQGDLTFANVSADWGLNFEGVSFGAAYGDLDGDGDMDLIVNHFDGPVSLYENRASNRHVTLRLVGTGSNRWGLGARVVAAAGPTTQTRYLTLSRGFAGSDEPVVHFGLGQNPRIDRLTIHWPGGHTQSLGPLLADHHHAITEPGDSPSAAVMPDAPKPLFAVSRSSLAARHVEKPFDDFLRQPLLPNKLSQLGPGAAWGDANGDGQADFFLGGGAGQPGSLWINRGPDAQGVDQFSEAIIPALRLDAACEDMGAVWFDADADGDEDLYVVSGGVESEAGTAALADRLYINDGNGALSRAPAGRLPDARDSGSCVVVADMDRDGDLDLFVGGRVVPGAYPTSPGSRLLLNDGAGLFTDATSAQAPALQTLGLVTAALWTDVDLDGWVDLLVACEWQSLRLIRNEKGRLVDATAGTGLDAWSGWWNGLAAGDFDQDGDVDYVVTNFGLNTKYHPKARHPVRLFYGEFDGSGRAQIVEAKEQADGRWLPVRGKSCSQAAMPFLRQKFPTFHQFASASLQEIYGPALDAARQLSVNELSSGILWNLSPAKPSFSFEPLPMLAQVAPGFGVQVADVNGDGFLDVVVAHNFFTPQRETGRMSGGLGAVLLGEQKGRFISAWPDRSGFALNADAKSLTLADLNRDGREDVVVAVNDGPLRVWINQGAWPPPRALELQGPRGNPHAIGARVVFLGEGGSRRAAELHLGEGYLSQSGAFRRLRIPADARSLEVYWPQGGHSKHRLQKSETGAVVFREPTRPQ